MSPSVADRPRVLVVGGFGGFVGRSLLPALAPEFRLRSVHRSPVPAEAAAGVEWIRGDAADLADWESAVRDVDVLVNVAWYRAGRAARFVALRNGLERGLAAAGRAGVRRVLQLSVPPAPEHLERGFPYLVEKRRFDAAVASSGISYRLLRPTMLFGPGDVLLSVMLREIRRYGFFPMFGDGHYHVSPLAVADLARVVRQEATSNATGVRSLGGPRRYEYRELTDLLFRTAGRRPRYWRMSERNGVRLAALLERLGSRLLYAYEAEWLVSDLLGLPPADDVPGGLTSVESYLGASGPSADAAPSLGGPTV